MVAFVQGTTGSYASGNTMGAAYTSNNTAHNLLILCAYWQHGVNVAPIISDTRGNAWSLIDVVRFDSNTGIDYGYYKCLNSAAGANTVTMNFGAPLTFGICAIHEFTDPLGGAHSLGFAQDRTAFATGGAATATSFSSGNTPATTVASEIVFGLALSTGGQPVAGSGFTQALVGTGGLATIYKAVAATGVQAATFTTPSAGTWDALCATFYVVAAAAAQTTPNPQVENIVRKSVAQDSPPSWQPRPPAAIVGPGGIPWATPFENRLAAARPDRGGLAPTPFVPVASAAAPLVTFAPFENVVRKSVVQDAPATLPLRPALSFSPSLFKPFDNILARQLIQAPDAPRSIQPLSIKTIYTLIALPLSFSWSPGFAALVYSPGYVADTHDGDNVKRRGGGKKKKKLEVIEEELEEALEAVIEERPALIVKTPEDMALEAISKAMLEYVKSKFDDDLDEADLAALLRSRHAHLDEQDEEDLLTLIQAWLSQEMDK